MFFHGERDQQQDDKSYCNFFYYLSSDAVPSFQLPATYITERVVIIEMKFERTRLDFRKSPSSYFDMARDLLGRLAASKARFARSLL